MNSIELILALLSFVSVLGTLGIIAWIIDGEKDE